MTTGAKPKLTPELTEQICARLKAGNFRETACAAVGIASRTLRIWLRQAAQDRVDKRATRYTKFADALDAAESEAEHLAIQRARIAGKDDWRFWTWWLEHKHNKRWGFKAALSVVLEDDREKLLTAAERVLAPDQYRKLLVELAASDSDDDPASEAASAEDVGGAGAQPPHLH